MLDAIDCSYGEGELDCYEESSSMPVVLFSKKNGWRLHLLSWDLNQEFSFEDSKFKIDI